MSDGNQKTLRERKEEKTRSEILTAAENLFNRYGLDQVSVQYIADEAFLSRATIYNYFGNKDSIMYALATERLREGNERLGLLRKSPQDYYSKVMLVVDLSFDAIVESPARNAILRRLLVLDSSRERSIEEEYSNYLDLESQRFDGIDEIPKEDQMVLRFLEELWQYENFLISLIQEGQVRGEISRVRKAAELAQFIIMSLNGLTDQLVLHKGPLRKYKITVGGVKELYLKAVRRVLVE